MLLDTSISSVATTRQAPDPRQYVFGVIDDPMDAIEAIERLHQTGFGCGAVTVDGPEEFAGVRIATEPTGLPSPLAGGLAEAEADPGGFWRHYAEQVSAGHTIIQVYAPDQADFDRALDVLEAHHAHAL